MAALHAFEATLLEEQDQISASSPPSPRSDYSSSSDLHDRDPVVHLGLPGLKRSNRLGWSFLCCEIARLNERFLC